MCRFVFFFLGANSDIPSFLCHSSGRSLLWPTYPPEKLNSTERNAYHSKMRLIKHVCVCVCVSCLWVFMCVYFSIFVCSCSYPCLCEFVYVSVVAKMFIGHRRLPWLLSYTHMFFMGSLMELVTSSAPTAVCCVTVMFERQKSGLRE